MVNIIKTHTFEPDYTNLLDAARNIEAKRLPVYDHIMAPNIMEALLGREFSALIDGSREDKTEFFRSYCEVFKKLEYDVVIYEICLALAMPGAGALSRHSDGVIKTMDDFNKYPWEELEDMYFNKYGENFDVLREVMPAGMKAIGGVGNGVFECVQEIVGYTNLCYIAIDDRELYEKLFAKMGDILLSVWTRFLNEYGDIFCVGRIGDDTGFKSGTLLSHDDIRQHIVPQYKRIIDVVHKSGKPFVWHSCGNIFDIMDDMIVAGINAKHSNEDVIAPFSVWVEKYGKRIGNFGGIDTDVICSDDTSYVKKYTTDILQQVAHGNGGIAIGTGNSVPDYVSIAGFTAMNEAIRDFRNM